MTRWADPSDTDDELERAFPGSSLSHVLTVRSCDEVGATVALLHLLRAAGGRLLTLSLARYEDAFDHRIVLAGLGAGQARALAGRLAATPGVHSARVEHQISRAA